MLQILSQRDEIAVQAYAQRARSGAAYLTGIRTVLRYGTVKDVRQMERELLQIKLDRLYIY